MRATVTVILLALGTTAMGQTNDHLFRSWRWDEDVTAPRAAGMGGAFVAVADDSSAAFLTPAGLTPLPKNDLAGGLMARRSGTSSLGDTLRARTGVGYVGGAGRITKRFAVGGYLTEPQDRRTVLDASGGVLGL